MPGDSNFLDISENNGTRSLSNLSNLERNCNQIFGQGPAITKDFFDKIQHEVVPQKTDLFGYQMNTRRLFVLTGLFLLFTFSTVGTITMWFTDTYQKQINAKMVLSETSATYDLWRSPSVRPYVKIYLFNYTNVDDFESGRAKKLHIKELGPYVYFEQVEKVNIRFNKVDGTVSYQEKRTYRLNEELSKGSKEDLLIVPNIPLISGAFLAKHRFNFFARMSYSGLLKTLSARPFMTVTADKFIFGYNDQLYDLSKNYFIFKDKRVFESFGLLVWKTGIQPDIITVNTGIHDISKVGQIESFNGNSHVDLWSSESCNNIRASDGVKYSPSLMKSKNNLTIFVPQMCRKLTLKYEKETTVLDKVPVYRYKMPNDIFDSGDNNKCYCNKQDGKCPRRGVFNSTLCAFGAPVFYSWPYFEHADPIFKNALSGMERPSSPIDEPFLDIHSKVGLLLRGKMRVQANIQLLKSFGISQLNAYPDDLMLPMVWLEIGLDEKDLPSDVVSLIYQITFTVRNLELGLKYGFLLAMTVTLISILLVLKKHRESRKISDSLQRMDLAR